MVSGGAGGDVQIFGDLAKESFLFEEFTHNPPTSAMLKGFFVAKHRYQLNCVNLNIVYINKYISFIVSNLST